MQVGFNQRNSPSPANVTKIVAAATFFFQALPPIIEGSGAIGPHTKEVVSLICDVLNIAVAAVAVLFGTSASQNENK